MSKLYSKPSKVELMNSETGEVKKILIENRHISNGMFPKNSKYKRTVYMDDLSKIVELNKTEQLMFFAILENVNEFNIVVSKWKDIAKDITSDQSRISKTVKVLKDKNFISKIESKYMVNPFIVLPKQKQSETNKNWLLQQIWNLYNNDLNVYIPEEHYEDVEFILNIKNFNKSNYIKVGKGKNSKFIEKYNNQ